MAMPLPTSSGLLINLLPRTAPAQDNTSKTPEVTSLKVTKTELDWAISMASGGDFRDVANASHRSDKTMEMVRALNMALPAVAQPEYRGVTPTGRMVNGIDGAKMLLDGFGGGTHRTIHLNPEILKAVALALPMLSRERVNRDLAGAARTSEERDAARASIRQAPAATRAAGFGR